MWKPRAPGKTTRSVPDAANPAAFKTITHVNFAEGTLPLLVVEDDVARVFACGRRGASELPEATTLARVAVSLGRYVQVRGGPLHQHEKGMGGHCGMLSAHGVPMRCPLHTPLALPPQHTHRTPSRRWPTRGRGASTCPSRALQPRPQRASPAWERTCSSC